MALWNTIQINGTSYDVRVVQGSLQRTATIQEGKNGGVSLRGRKIRDIQGVAYKYTFQVEPNPSNPTAYDTFFELITTPTDYLTITMPYGQTTKTFEAYVESVSDTYTGTIASYKRWAGCKVTFTSIAPVRTS